MKGTLFSADFVYDSSDNPRLLEINTDTGFIQSVVDSHISFTDFKQVLIDNGITKLHLIYKPLHVNFIDKLVEFVNDECDFITEVEKYVEAIDSIYPTVVADAVDKFILRLAYDENAILDSKYAKKDVNVHKLYHDRDDSDSVIPAIHSSSLAVYDTLEHTFNSSSMPDFVSKPVNPGGLLKFYKLGVPESGSSYRVNALTASVNLEDNTLMSYLDNYSNGRVKSVRSFRIIYGSNLDLVELGTYEIESTLYLPQTIHDEDDLITEVNHRHYLEFATNDIKGNKGVNKSTYIKKTNGTGIQVSDIITGSAYSSYFISGSPDTDDSAVLEAWSYSGNILPSGSYPTSSVLINTTDLRQKSFAQHKLTFGSQENLLAGSNSILPAYRSSTDEIRFLQVRELLPGDELFLSDGSTTHLLSHSVVFYDTELEAETTELNLEDTDIYIVSGSDVIVHNGPCFAAGTLVWDSPTSEKNIEDFKVGDTALTYNFESGEFEAKEVLGVTSRKVSSVVLYSFSNGKTLKATLDHPLYVEGLGWASADPALSNSMYEIGEPIHQLEVGQKLKSIVGPDYILDSIEVVEEPTVVYNLSHVDGNHNFFANNVLAHNRIAIFSCFSKDSLVEMFDGTHKLISEVQIGDKVKSTYKGQVVEGTVTETLVHPIMSRTEVVKFNGVTAEPNHPIYVNGNWIPAKEAIGAITGQEYIDFYYNLEVDGNKEDSEHNYFTGGYYASGLGDSKKLNDKYQRQPLELTKHL